MNVILCGYNWTGCKALKMLLEEGHNVFVYTHESPYFIPSLANYCRDLGIPFTTNDISKSEIPFIPDIICSIYYRYIIKEHVINMCKGRIFNLHPSLLPAYKGCGSVTWAIINGETTCGFSYHYINSGIDTGRIILQKEVEIEDFDFQSTLYTRVMFTAMNYFKEALKLVANGFQGIEQEGTSSYYKRGSPFNGIIDDNWNEALRKRFIRAMINPPYPVATFRNNEVRSYNDLEDLNKK